MVRILASICLLACSSEQLVSSFMSPHLNPVYSSCLSSTTLFAKRRTKVNFGRQKEKPSSNSREPLPSSPSFSSSQMPSSPVDRAELTRKVALADARKNYMKKNNINEEQMRSEEQRLLKQVTGTGRNDLMGEIESDIANFREREENVNNVGSVVDANESGNVRGFSFGDLIAKILVADLFLVLVFLVWFIAAAVTQQQGNPYLLERFQDIFEPVVQPALGVLMIGSIASGISDKDKDDKN